MNNTFEVVLPEGGAWSTPAGHTGFRLHSSPSASVLPIGCADIIGSALRVYTALLLNVFSGAAHYNPITRRVTLFEGEPPEGEGDVIVDGPGWAFLYAGEIIFSKSSG